MNLLQFLPRFRQAYRALAELEARESWSRLEVEAYQLERLNAVWSHAVVHVPHYRRLAAELALPSHFASLQEFRHQVPVLARGMVRDRPEDFLSERAGRGDWDRTSGSTGTPLHVFMGKAAHLEMLQARYRHHAVWGVDVFDRWAFLWGRGSGVRTGLSGRIARFRQAVIDRSRNRMRLSAYHLARDDLRRHLARIASFRPVALYGYSQAVRLLAREAEMTGFRCDSLRMALLTSEPACPDTLTAIERSLGVPTVMEYGATECGMIAAQWPDRTLRVREDLVAVETLPRDDGHFDIVLTVLNNPAFPLLRYAIGDVTDAPLKAPACGFSILANVTGRNNDLIVSRSGRPIHATRFETLFEHEVRDIRRFRVHQHSDGALSVTVEMETPSAPLDKTLLERKLRDLVEDQPLRIEVVGAIPLTQAGKYRPITSVLAGR